MTETRPEIERNATELKARQAATEFLRAKDSEWIDSHMPTAAMNRCLGLIQQEREIERANQEKTDHAAAVNEIAYRELALAREIELEKRRTYSDVARRQFLRENDPQLKTLRKKLTAGYVCRDIRKQIANNEYRRLQEKAEEKYNDCVIRKAMATDKEIDLKEEKEDKEKKARYRAELMKQMELNLGTRGYEIKVKQAEKKQMEEILKKYAEEDMRKKQAICDSKARLWCEMISCKESRAAWKQEQADEQQERMDRMWRERAADDVKTGNLKAERDAKNAAKEAVIRKVAEKNLAEAKARQLREDMIRQLQEEEEEERKVQLDLMERRKEVSMIMDNKTALELQMRLKREDRVREKEVDLKYRNEMVAKKAKEDEAELEKFRKQREKIKKYSEDLKIQMEFDKKKRKEDQEELDAWNRYALGESDIKKNQELKEERSRLIEEHAPHVLGYLQAGVLQHEDLPSVRRGADRHPHLNHLDIEAMGRRGLVQRFPKCNLQCVVLRNY